MYHLPILGSNKTVEAALPEKVKSHVLYEVVRWQLASRRRGTAATKTRGMVNFTTKKMYGQKHTGRARHGDYGAPIFVGGGTVFGPQPRDYSYTLPKKVRKLGLSMALADRAKEGKFFLVEDFKGVSGKTKEFVAWLKAHNLESPSILAGNQRRKGGSCGPQPAQGAGAGPRRAQRLRHHAPGSSGDGASAWPGVQAKLGQSVGGEA